MLAFACLYMLQLHTNFAKERVRSVGRNRHWVWSPEFDTTNAYGYEFEVRGKQGGNKGSMMTL